MSFIVQNRLACLALTLAYLLPPDVVPHPRTRQASESTLRQQAADGHLRERSTRASLLSLAVAQAFRQGRERLLAARALKTLRDAARARRLASAAATRIRALRLSRVLHAWSSGTRRRSKPRAADATSVVAAGRVSALRLSRCLWSWGDKARRGHRRRGLVAAGVEALSSRRKRAALRVLKDACRGREASAAAAARDVARLRLSRMRRGLRNWGRAAFGAGWGGERWVGVGRGSAGEGGGRGSRVLARLEGVAAAVNAAGERRRARTALRRWLGHAQGVRRRAAVER